MFTELLLILINVFLLSSGGTIPVIYETNCSSSKLGCNCQNIEIITKESVESCCKSKLRTLLITGWEVRNISINIINSPCSKHFQNLVIRDTGIVSFNSPFYGLENVVNINIDKNPNFTDFNKLYFYEVSQKIHTISVENNILKTIMTRTFANLTSLVNLKLSDNRIGRISDSSFADLANLTDLQLNNNILTNLHAEMFLGLETLKILSLLNNFLMEFKSDTFKYLPNLQFLHLSCSYNEFKLFKSTIPDRTFFAVKRLKFLTMKLRIKNLTSMTFYGLNDLEKLDLKGNQLTVISSGTLQQVPKVADINLSRNQLKCFLSNTFRNLPRLMTLDLSYNDLSYISNEVFADLFSLQTLDLSENNIYVMEKNSFVGLKSLLILTMNVVHGKAKNELQNSFRESSLAKLRNNTIIRGLDDYLGINRGFGEPREILNVKPMAIELMKDYCPIAGASDKDWVDSSQAGSRKYLLIIVGICVVFLLIAFAIIMSYRAWSKHKMNDLSFNVDAHEKQEMLVNKPTMINGRICSKNNSESNQTRKSLNGSYMPDVSVDKSEEKTDPFATSQTHQTNSQASIKPVTCPLSNERNHSDDESALTPLGVL